MAINRFSSFYSIPRKLILIWSMAMLTANVMSFDEKAGTDHTIMDLFQSLTPKSTPIYLCPTGRTAGVKYRIPPPMECPILSNEDIEETEFVIVTFYWPNPQKQVIKANECWSETTLITNFQNFWGTEITVTEKAINYISESQCREMVKSLRTPDGVALERLREGSFGTKINNVPSFSWLRTTTETNVNYYFSNTQMSVNNKDDTIQTFLPVTDNCLESSGYCATDRGIVVWSPSKHAQCRMKEGKTTACLLTGNKLLSCDEANLSTVNLTVTELCGTKVGVSGQGVYFTLMESNLNLPRASTTEVARVKLGLTVGDNRYKTDLIDDIKLVTYTEMNVKFQYLHELLQLDSKSNIRLFMSQICRNNQMTLRSIRYQAETGSPTTLAQVLLEDSSYRSRLLGDVLSVWKCEEVTQYMFMNRGENCTLEFPVRYMYGGVEHEAFLAPLSKVIVQTATTVECPSPSFYFDMKDQVVLLSKISIISNLPYLPNPGEATEGRTLKDVTFNATGEYSLTEITNDNTLYEMTKSNSNRASLNVAIDKKESGRPVTRHEQRLLDQFSNFSLTGTIQWFNKIMYGFLSVVLIIGILFLWRNIQPLIKAIRLVIRMIRAAWNGARAAAESLYDVIINTTPPPPPPPNPIIRSAPTSSDVATAAVTAITALLSVSNSAALSAPTTTSTDVTTGPGHVSLEMEKMNDVTMNNIRSQQQQVHRPLPRNQPRPLPHAPIIMERPFASPRPTQIAYAAAMPIYEQDVFKSLDTSYFTPPPTYEEMEGSAIMRQQHRQPRYSLAALHKIAKHNQHQ